MNQPVWDHEAEPYESFLEKLPEKLQKGLAEGTAYMAVPGDGYNLMTRFMDSARQNDSLAEYMVFIDGIETEDECKQLISDIAALEVVAVSIAKSLLKRRHDIHKTTCDTCGADDAPTNGQVKRAIDAARQAFLDTIQGDDPEAWKGD